MTVPWPQPSESSWIGLAEDLLPLTDAHQFLIDEWAGGVCLFTGVVRRWTGDVETARLGYEAYEKMAFAELERLAANASERWPVVRLVLLHRVGEVIAGEASVIVGVACPHRADAFDACRWLIDTLKAEVPIWKDQDEVESPPHFATSIGPTP